MSPSYRRQLAKPAWALYVNGKLDATLRADDEQQAEEMFRRWVRKRQRDGVGEDVDWEMTEIRRLEE